ncbi:hypothetical protein CLSAB_19250 [Clostridium saccharobutylicum]|uniref:hypothetical protein n=1 Tax=Clostridium saccharobutylicum TaxID=169679 RepID=UPI00098BD082|nr:hypothetical protein [Clostridium saccharobutylicum]OOM17205.1 hypothetical protein CLSAB_19250 [Clostridium saccharobutylicum]
MDTQVTRPRKYKGKLECKSRPITSFNLNPGEFIEPHEIINRFTYSIESQGGMILYNFIAGTKEETDKKIKIAEPLMDLIDEISWLNLKIEREYSQNIIGYPLIRDWEEEKKQLQHKLAELTIKNKFTFKIEHGTLANTYILEG